MANPRLFVNMWAETVKFASPKIQFQINENMNAWLTILLLVVSNVFMTFAWYGHLKLQ